MITIALVVMCGITSYITMRSAYDSLLFSRDRYYEDYRFADLFVSVKRAPLSVERRLAQIRGVAEVQARVVESVLVPLATMNRPASGTVVSLDEKSQSRRLNDVHIRRGRALQPGHSDEVLVTEGFALAHHLEPGDTLPAVINGTMRTLRIVGIALSPEYVMIVAPGQMSYDPGASPVLWMNQSALSAAFQMEGAFNNATFQLSHGADVADVVAQIDQILEDYGSFGTVLREKQTSHFMLSGELTQLDNMAGFVPYLFLFVAALLVNVVLSRLVQLQRGIIATLKAVGYSNTAIGLHYLELVGVIVVAGALLGVACGAYLGREMMNLYTGQYFRFPDPSYTLHARAIFFSVGVSAISAVVGALVSVRHVVGLPPAEAMRPPAPAKFKRSVLETIGLWSWLDPNARMIWREVSRRPLRLLLSALGISLALGIVVVARSMWDSMEYLIEVQFHRSMREDLNVAFDQPLDEDALATLAAMEGVLYVEGLRSVPVRFRAGHRHRDSVLHGYPDAPRLRLLVDSDGKYHSAPPDGVLLTRKLGEILDVAPGDRVLAEVREGEWKTTSLTVAGLVDEPFGLAGHMSQSTLSRLLNDTGPINTALLSVHPERHAAVEGKLKDFPRVMNVSSPLDFKRQFGEQSVAIMNVFTMIMTIFASIIAVGVVYNNARVALSARNRDLASLRVLGFTQREIATILFGEQAIQVALAIPMGLVVGKYLAFAMMTSAVDAETYRLPVMVSARTYLYAIAVAVASAFFSAILLQRKLSKLDLIGVLKTRE